MLSTGDDAFDTAPTRSGRWGRNQQHDNLNARRLDEEQERELAHLRLRHGLGDHFTLWRLFRAFERHCGRDGIESGEQ
jgi:hypothetical protein